MNLFERYELILEQGIQELSPPEMPADRDKAFELQARLAPQLGDILYRLSIEHGIAFAPFRETVISIIAEPHPARADGSPFIAELEEVHPLILLALEMMPAEAPDM